MTTTLQPAWWKETIVYQIYPRSFQDSNGDGIGDLRGIIARLDYVASLGVETLWLNPIFQSPNDDNGYDVSDYRAIMKDFGTMADFDELMAEAKKRGLKILLDLVPNHSSDEHFWFKESRKSKDNPYRDYYFWKPPKPDGSEPTNWGSILAPKAWDYDEQTGEYYLHIFSKKQPDLNWDNPKVRQEIYEIMHFWMQKGIAGFRIDVLTFISKDLTFPEQTDENFGGDTGKFFGNGPRLHEFLQEMHEQVLSKYDMMTVGEGPGISVENAHLYVAENRKELHTIYHFEHMGIDRVNGHFFKPKPYTLPDFKAIVSKWDTLAEKGGWNTAFLGNHDFPRMVSRFGNDTDFRTESAKLLGLFLLTQRGTPYLYFGDEIGMTNTPWEALSDYKDLHVFDSHKKWLEEGLPEAEFLQNLKHCARDNARTPMQWDSSQHAGFSAAKPWLSANPNYAEINVAAAEKDPASILHFYRKAIAFRKANRTLVYGHYQDLLPEHEALYVYLRKSEEASFLVALNFSEENQAFMLAESVKTAPTVELGNYPDSPSLSERQLLLRPWEAVLLSF